MFFKILFLHTPSLGGFSENEILIFVGSYLIMDAIDMIFLSNNLWWLPTYIQKGELDYALIRPVSSRFLLSFRDIAANSAVNLLMAISILLIGVRESGYHFTLPSILLFFTLMGLGFNLLYKIRLITIIPMFWLHSNNGLNDIFYSLRKTMERPADIFSGAVKKILTSIIPFALIISYPVKVLLHGTNSFELLYFIGVVISFHFLALWLWEQGLKNYSSASS